MADCRAVGEHGTAGGPQGALLDREGTDCGWRQ